MIAENKKAALKEKLEALRAQLEQELKGFKNPTEMGDEIDALDTEADEAEEFSANAGMAQSIQDRHEAVVAALSKLERGGYGVCEECGGEIEPALLDVDPESRCCKNCKTKQA
jgi:DnaK suppressor protein